MFILITPFFTANLISSWDEPDPPCITRYVGFSSLLPSFSLINFWWPPNLCIDKLVIDEYSYSLFCNSSKNQYRLIYARVKNNNIYLSGWSVTFPAWYTPCTLPKAAAMENIGPMALNSSWTLHTWNLKAKNFCRIDMICNQKFNTMYNIFIFVNI